MSIIDLHNHWGLVSSKNSGTGRPVQIYEPSMRAGHGYRESPHRHHGCFEAPDCGRLGRQAADHPWSALRVVKSCRKDCPTASGLLEAKAAALHPERYQSSLSKLSTKEGGRGGGKKGRKSDGAGNQNDRKKERQGGGRQVVKRKAGTDEVEVR